MVNFSFLGHFFCLWCRVDQRCIRYPLWSLSLREFCNFPPVNLTWRGIRSLVKCLHFCWWSWCSWTVPHFVPRDSLGSVGLSWLLSGGNKPVTLLSCFSGVLCFKERCWPQYCSPCRWRWWVCCMALKRSTLRLLNIVPSVARSVLVETLSLGLMWMGCCTSRFHLCWPPCWIPPNYTPSQSPCTGCFL